MLKRTPQEIAVISCRSSIGHVERLLHGLGESALTRRRLLQAASGAAGVLPIIGPLARASADLEVVADQNSLQLLVAGEPAWTVDVTRFDGRPILTVAREPGRLRARLERALFPGTNLSADLRFEAARTSGVWRASIEFPGLAFRATVALDQWLLDQAPAEATALLPAFGDSGHWSVASADVTMKFHPNWLIEWKIAAGTKTRIGPRSMSPHAMRLEVLAPADASVLERESPRRSRLWLDELSPARIEIATTGAVAIFGADRSEVMIESSHDEHAVVLRSHAGDDQLLLVRSDPGDITALTVPVRGPLIAQLPASAEARISGIWSDRATTFQDGEFVAQVRAAKPLLAFVLEEGGSVGGISSAEAAPPPGCAPQHEEVSCFAVPVEDLDSAVFVLRRGGAGGCTSTQVSKRLVHLDDYDLVVRRGADALFCTVRFLSVDLVRESRGWLLRSRNKHAMVEFEFTLQHIDEEATYVTSWCPNKQALCEDVITPSDEVVIAVALADVKLASKYRIVPGSTLLDHVKHIHTDLTCDEYEALLDEAVKLLKKASDAADITRARAASPTRLLFSFADADPFPLPTRRSKKNPPTAPSASAEIDFSAANLFDWAGRRGPRRLFPKVVSRAAPEGVLKLDVTPNPLESPLGVRNPQPSPDFARYGTAIEAPTGLTLSPIPVNGEICWQMADQPMQGSARVPLWHAYLRNWQVRAIYSPDLHFEDGVFQFFDPPPAFPIGHVFRPSLDKSDHHQKVALTSVFGEKALCGSKQVICTTDPTMGTFMPTPIDARLLLVSSQGASLRLAGSWDPPSSPPNAVQKGALSVMRYDHNAQLGRDTLVRVEYKGFLMPIGHPAILVKETERRFCFEETAKGKHRSLTARLVQRFYIKVPRFVRAFPTIGQPFDNRDWHHGRIQMDALVTPTLKDPHGEHSFWPEVCVQDGPGAGKFEYYRFEFYDPDRNERYVGPLMFIDNFAAHDTSGHLITAINKYREQIRPLLDERAVWKPSRGLFQVATGRLQYTPESKADEATLQTDLILIGINTKGCDAENTRSDAAPPALLPSDQVIGGNPQPAQCGQNASAGSEAIVFGEKCLAWSSVMEREAQPPFYPFRRRMRVRSGAMGAISGRGGRMCLLDYDRTYVELGFDGKENAGEIYGVFTMDGPRLEFGSDTSRSGGFVSPSSDIVWMSRKRGPMGGPIEQRVPWPNKVALRSVATSSSSRLAFKDGMDPRDFFKGAKLFGIVDLADVLAVVGGAAQKQIPQIKDELENVIEDVSTVVGVVLGKIEEVKDALNLEGVPAKVRARLLPPVYQLTSIMTSAKQRLDSGDLDLPAIAALGNAAYQAAKTFSDDTRGLLEDPMALMPDELASLVAGIQVMQNELLALVQDPGKFLSVLVQQAVTEALGDVAAQVAAYERQFKDLVAQTQEYPEVHRVVMQVNDAVATVKSVKDSIAGAVTGGQALADWLAGQAISRLAGAVEEVAFLQAQLLSTACTELVAPVNGVLKQLNDAAKGATQDVGQKLEGLREAHANAHRGLSRKLDEIDPGAQLPEARAKLAQCREQLAAHLTRINDFNMLLLQVAVSSGTAMNMIDATCAIATPRSLRLSQRSSDRDGEGIPRFTTVGAGLDGVLRLIELGAALLDDARRVASSLEELGQLEPQLDQSDVVTALVKLLGCLVEFLRGHGPFAPNVHWDALDHVITALNALPNRGGVRLLADVEAMVKCISAVQTWHRDTLPVMQDPQAVLAELERRLTAKFISGLVGEASRWFGYVLQMTNAEAEVRTRLQQFTKLRQKLEIAATNLIDATRFKIREIVVELLGMGTVVRGVLDAIGGSNNDLVRTLFPQDVQDQITRFTNEVDGLDATPTSNSLQDARMRLELLQECLRHLTSLVDQLVKCVQFGDRQAAELLRRLADELLGAIGIPTRLKARYDWNTPVQPYPAGSPLFEPIAADGEPMVTGTLTLSAVTEVDLRTGAISSSVEGTLSEVRLNLLTKALPFLVVTFKPIRFTVKGDSGARFDIKIDKVVPGKALSFVSNISSLFGGTVEPYLAGGSGGIEVGIRYVRDFQLLGGMTLLNIDFGVSVILPFDNSPMRIAAHLSSADIPFLVVLGIYGGGGHMLMRANATALEVIEASFMYGLVTGFNFGPASGQGRIVAGIFIRLGGNEPFIEGFFHATGRANIAGIITCGVSFRVSLHYELNTNKTSGQAEFSVSFSIGPFDYSYRVGVAYSQDGDSDKKQASLESSALMVAGDALVDWQHPALAEGDGYWRAYWAHPDETALA